MFTHRAEIQLKPDSCIELAQKIRNRIMPPLRLRKGVRYGVTAAEDTRRETIEEAETYRRTGYPETLKTLSEVLDAEPVTSILEVSEAGFKRSQKPF
jgi:hypothetical protein